MHIHTPEDTRFVHSFSVQDPQTHTRAHTRTHTHTHTLGPGQAVTGLVARGRWCTWQGAGWVEGSACVCVCVCVGVGVGGTVY